MEKLYIGLMSGTSLDGLDAVLVDCSSSIPRVIETHSRHYPDELRKRILKVCTPGDDNIDNVAHLDIELGQWFAEGILELLIKSGKKPEEIIAIGSHGQTIRHRPEGPHCFSLQIADPNTIAYKTGITTVADFRRMDMAAGGQGAPLVPAFHKAIFGSDTEDRVILNIGGISNITLLPTQGEVIGFDTGPGNVLMDAWMQSYYDRAYDADGEVARSGQIQEQLLHNLLEDEYLELAPPKSTGREHFNMEWLTPRLHKTMAARDVMATLTEYTATTIAIGINRFAGSARRCYLCGGGARNSYLMERIRSHLIDVDVMTTDELGLSSGWVEATAFAWLAKCRIEGMSGNLPAVTGAQEPVLLGGVYQPR